MNLGKISRKSFFAISAILLTPLVAAADAFWVEPQWIKIRKVALPGVNKGGKQHRFVHFTDLHHKGDRDYLDLIVRKINALSADLVLFTGDLIEEKSHLPETLEFLAKIKSPLIGVPGNHDYWANADFPVIAKTFGATGGAWLMDEQFEAADGKILVTGADCLQHKRSQDIPLPAPKPGFKNIMIFHYPIYCERLGRSHFDLILAGHSHGGQVRLPFHGPLIHSSHTGKYDLGFYQTPSGPMYVNPGLGWYHLPIRFNCRPEITVFEF